MALIDVVKYEMKDGEFCHKYPSEDLRLGTQLVVYPSQTAFFVRGGSIFDEFTSGTYTIKTNNIPLLNKIINLPFGGDTPFKAEVWYINQISKLDLAWGTSHPIQLEDPKYKIIVPVRAHGQYGIKIVNPRLFLETLIGNMTSFSSDKIDQYFKGKLISLLNSVISNEIINNGFSVLDINTQLITMSQSCEEKLNANFAKYGINIVEFSIMSINVPQEDPSVIRLKQAKDTMARLSITGRDVYQMERSFDVLEKAASNQGVGGQMIGMGVGMGVGMNAGSTMGAITSQMINTNPAPTPPPLNMNKSYYLYINGNQVPNQTIQQIALYIQQGIVNGETPVWCAGMPQWGKLSEIPELNSLFGVPAPPPLNM